jgi:hypothetical protein
MALKGQLKIEGINDSYTVVECEYYFNQSVNRNNGLPESGMDAGQIIVTIVTPSKGKPLYEWMLDEFNYLNGVIKLVTNVNSHRPANRYVWFLNGKCVNLYEYFNSHNSVMMTTRLTIQPAKMGFMDGDKLDGASVGYDFRHKRRSDEAPDATTNKIGYTIADRNKEYTNQILNDSNF